MKKSILFWGDDPDYTDAGKTYYSELGGEKYSFIHFSPGPDSGLLKAIKETECALVYIDFTHHNCSVKKVLHELSYIKRHRVYREVVMVGVFKDKEHLNNLSSCIHFGINFLFIKGIDIHQLFIDGTYIAFEDKQTLNQFARVKDMRLPYDFHHQSYVTQISSDHIKVNCDLFLTDETLRLKYHFISEGKVETFSVHERHEAAEYGYALACYDLKFPYPGPWGEVTADSLLKDSVDTRLAQYEDFSPPHRKFLIYSFSDELFEGLVQMEARVGEEFQFEQLNLLNRLSSLKPEVVVIDYSEEENGDFQEFMNTLILGIKNISEYYPTLIVFNSKLSSSEFKDEFHCPALCDKKPCELETLTMLLKLYTTKKGYEPLEGVFDFEDEDKNSLLDVVVPVTITGLTEHEITFLSNSELPMFSIFKIDVPVNAYVLVVPTYFNLTNVENKFHYMGIIMGLDFFELNNIRNFVNQAIFQPLKEFKRIDISKQVDPAVPDLAKEEPSILREAPSKPNFEVPEYSRKKYRLSKL